MPRSVDPPKLPAPVRQGALFQLNMVTLTSVIFIAGLLGRGRGCSGPAGYSISCVGDATSPRRFSAGRGSPS